MIGVADSWAEDGTAACARVAGAMSSDGRPAIGFPPMGARSPCLL